MKFATIQDVFEKFFKITKLEKESVSNVWAVRRLLQLERAGYLKGIFMESDRTKYYLATMKAYQRVSRVKPDEKVMRPSLGIDDRTFDHDRYVLQARIMLENQRSATCWVSDKRLRSGVELAGGLSGGNIPDGIYIDGEGRKVAFEFENRQKSKSDYMEKIRRYVAIMRSVDVGERLFERVMYVCVKNGAYEFLVRETEVFGGLFEVVRVSDFFGRCPKSDAKAK